MTFSILDSQPRKNYLHLNCPLNLSNSILQHFKSFQWQQIKNFLKGVGAGLEYGDFILISRYLAKNINKEIPLFYTQDIKIFPK